MTGIFLIWKPQTRAGLRRAAAFDFAAWRSLGVSDHQKSCGKTTPVRRPNFSSSAWQTRTSAQNKDKLAPTVATGSMPSSHAANWFAATMVVFIYFRRSFWFMLPAALLVSFSRIYNGLHYPSDVLAEAILGAGYAAATIWCLEALWQWAGENGFHFGGRCSIAASSAQVRR